MRRMLTDALRRQGFDVVAEAADGDQALDCCRMHQPDALTLDLAMPGLDGIGVLRALRDGKGGESPVGVVVVSAFSPAHGARAVDALAEGAFDLVAKPALGEPFDGFMTELASKVELAATSTHRRRPATPSRPERRPSHPRPSRPARGRVGMDSAPARAGSRVVIIACSTGGPKALARLVPQLPGRLGQGGFIVQHMPPGFTKSLASRLDAQAAIGVREAAAGDGPDPGTLLMAPGGAHVRLGADRRVALSDERVEGGLCPRADLTIKDLAERYGGRVLLVVLTGMGKDGLEGARAVKAAGGVVLAESEATCTVYGMPRAVVDAGLADEVLALEDLPDAIRRHA
jgi:two-component system chemotaxis response regulator CheB